MKAIYLFVLFGLATSLSAIGQIRVKFSETESNLFIEQSIDINDGFTRKTLDLEITVPTRVTQDYLIKVKLENITTRPDELKLVTETFTLTQSELNTPGIIKRKIEYDVAFNDTMGPSRIAKISLGIDGVLFDADLHERLLTISPTIVEPEKEALTETEEKNKALLNQLKEEDSEDIAAMTLNLDKNGIAQYVIRKMVTRNDKYIGCSEKLNELVDFKVSLVKVFFEDGRISRIIVIPSELEGHFETRYPISATSFDRNSNDLIFYSGNDLCMKRAAIHVGSILSYMGLSSRKRFPPSGEMVLTPDKPSDTLTYKRNPLSFFDLRAYTDPLGLNGTANGLVQSEMNAHFIGNTQNFRYLTLFPTVKVGFSLSKFDSKFDTLSFNTLSNRADNDLLRIQQQANVNLAFEVDFFKLSRVHDYSISAGHHFSMSNIKDTASNFARAVTPSFFTSYNMTLNATPWIQLDFKFPFYMTYLHDNIFQDYSKKWDFYVVPELEIRIRPARVKDSEERSSISIFARAKYFDMINTRGENFLQLQTGISISLKDLFN